MRQLGSNQRSVLRCLLEYGSYSPGGGWLWNSRSGTEKILDSLVERGLVSVRLVKTSWRKVKHYTINQKGRDELKRLREAGRIWPSR